MNHLGVFAKYWQPGKVKTRLAVTIGQKSACEVYLAMLSFLVDSLGSTGDVRTIGYSPSDRESEFAQLCADLKADWNLEPQVDRSLGERMSQFFQTVFSQQTRSTPQIDKSILIGSDCPYVTPGLCDDAFDVLATKDVVLGPTYDGGYYMVGMSQQYHEIFSGITFSTETVFEQTIQKMEQSGISFGLLPTQQDIDQSPQLTMLVNTFRRQKLANQLSQKQDALLTQIQSILNLPQNQPS